MTPVSVLILTFNEEKNIATCLETVLNWADDIVVLDSFSTDRTKEIVTSYGGVRFQEHTFSGYAKQRNYALQGISYKYPWLLMIDADEKLSPELATEIQENIKNVSDDVDLFRMRRKDYFMGKWLRRSSGYPTWFGRLMRIGKVTINREVNEEYHAEGKVVSLKAHLIHYPFNKGLTDWFAKHNRYSTMEAKLLGEDTTKFKWCNFITRDPVKRRAAIKSLIYSLPGRPILVFCLLYFFRLGFLDGKAGLMFCRLRMIYEQMISCKLSELRGRKKC